MSKTKIVDCDFCHLPITGSYVKVSPNTERPEGLFHHAPVGEEHGCFDKACEAFDAENARRLHADVETVCEAELPRAHRVSA